MKKISLQIITGLTAFLVLAGPVGAGLNIEIIDTGNTRERIAPNPELREIRDLLRGEYARSDSLGIAFAGPGQNQDTGSKVIHAAPNTTSTIKAKSISKGGGISTYRGLVKVAKNAVNTKSGVVCDALLIDNGSASNTYPYMNIETNKVNIAHEASVGKIGEEEIFYLMSRGLTEEQAMQMVVSGFIEPIVKQLPMEYAVELNKLIELEMEGTVGWTR